MKITRKIIEIDEERCTGCGQCIIDCAEGALKIIDGKARLVKDSYCDGLGACLGSCPEGALTVVEREADAFNEQAVHEYLQSTKTTVTPVIPTSCPGERLTMLSPQGNIQPMPSGGQISGGTKSRSELGQWPVQLRLLPPEGAIYTDKPLLILADCVAVAYPDLHRELIRGNTVAMTCPKLDDGHDTVARLSRIFANPIQSIQVAVMEVPCCSGLLHMVRQALQNAGKSMPVEITKISAQGSVLDKRTMEAAEA